MASKLEIKLDQSTLNSVIKNVTNMIKQAVIELPIEVYLLFLIENLKQETDKTYKAILAEQFVGNVLGRAKINLSTCQVNLFQPLRYVFLTLSRVESPKLNIRLLRSS